VTVLLTLTTTREPATDLGYLLVKHPDRVHEFELPTGVAHVCFPEANEQRCTAALILEVDPSRLGATRRSSTAVPDGFTLGRYVNDRPYAASSLLAGALNRVFKSAMRGGSPDRPELAASPMPLEIRIPSLRCRGGADLTGRLFGPLGWTVEATPVPLDPLLDWGPSRYVDLALTGEVRLADALNQLYVLLPVCDDAKHYWVAPDEVDKLLRAGAGWLVDHPERDLISRRYLAHRRGLATEANVRLEALRVADDLAGPDAVEPDGAPDAVVEEDAELPPAVAMVPLAEQRRRAVLAELERSGATRVLDLGCGSGALLADLIRDKRYTELVGVDAATGVLRLAERRLRLDRPDRIPERQRGRVRLLHSALTYSDDRLIGFDAAVLMEVIEHVDPPRLPALAASVFGHARPSTVVVTTPNVEYNVRYEGMAVGAMRHHDHRFEWTRAEFAAWGTDVAARYGYQIRFAGAGEDDAVVGPPTQLAVFTRVSAKREERAPASPAVASPRGSAKREERAPASPAVASPRGTA
jgi:3' terminal RNA ribose 2'-O-methyltransferase Hen1